MTTHYVIFTPSLSPQEVVFPKQVWDRLFHHVFDGEAFQEVKTFD